MSFSLQPCWLFQLSLTVLILYRCVQVLALAVGPALFKQFYSFYSLAPKLGLASLPACGFGAWRARRMAGRSLFGGCLVVSLSTSQSFNLLAGLYGPFYPLWSWSLIGASFFYSRLVLLGFLAFSLAATRALAIAFFSSSY